MLCLARTPLGHLVRRLTAATSPVSAFATTSQRRPRCVGQRSWHPHICGRPDRHCTTMASGLRSPAFTQAVVRAMRELYPEELADRRWDNVGLLLGNIDSASPSPLAAPLAAETTKTGTVLLTIDLTLAVVEEALRKHASVIVTYRRGLPCPPRTHAQVTT